MAWTTDYRFLLIASIGTGVYEYQTLTISPYKTLLILNRLLILGCCVWWREYGVFLVGCLQANLGLFSERSKADLHMILISNVLQS